MRRLPLICLIISFIRMAAGKLKISRRYHYIDLITIEGKVFSIFRYICLKTSKTNNPGSVFLVSFKFASLSFRANKLTSIIPMLIIAGTPGFNAKIYAVCPNDGYWLGIYQWDSIEHLKKYKTSFVFRMMKKRAVPESLSTVEIADKSLIDFLDEHRIKS